MTRQEALCLTGCRRIYSLMNISALDLLLLLLNLHPLYILIHSSFFLVLFPHHRWVSFQLFCPTCVCLKHTCAWYHLLGGPQQTNNQAIRIFFIELAFYTRKLCAQQENESTRFQPRRQELNNRQLCQSFLESLEVAELAQWIVRWTNQQEHLYLFLVERLVAAPNPSNQNYRV